MPSSSMNASGSSHVVLPSCSSHVTIPSPNGGDTLTPVRTITNGGNTSSSSSSSSSWLTSSILKPVVLVVLALGVIVTSASHTLFAQPFKDKVGFDNLSMPWYLTLVTIMGWPIPMIAWLISVRGRPNMPKPIKRRLSTFFFLAFLDAFNVLLGSIGLDGMSAAAFAIIRGSCLIFTVALSLMITNKKFNIFHYIGVLFMFSAVVIKSLMKPADPNGPGIGSPFVVAITILSAFFVSLLAVLTQKNFTDQNAKGDISFVWEIQAWQSLFSFLLTVPIILYFPEWRTWSNTFAHFERTGHLRMVKWLSFGMCISKPFMLFFNITATSVSSATYVRSLGGPKRLFVCLMAYILFGQKLDKATIISAAFMTFSLGIYVYGGVVLKSEKQSLKNIQMENAAGRMNTNADQKV